MKRTKATGMAAFMLCLILLGAITAPAQKNKFPDAIERSGDAARIIELLTVVPDSGFPKELVDKAHAIGVFPKVEKVSALFAQATHGHGVISTRLDNGWSMPAYYQFGGSGYGNPFAKNDMYSVILLFMTKDAVAAFEKGGVALKNEKKAIEGPVGVITDEQRKEMEGAHILAYAYFNGKLKGISFGKSFWKEFALNPDNKINKPLYGMKGREVLAGRNVYAGALPAGIPAYRDALQKYYGQR